MIFLLVSLLVVSPSANATEVRTFTVRAPVAAVVAYLAEHNDAVSAAARWHVVARSGDLVRVRRNTPKGLFDLTLRESIDYRGTVATYSTQLVHCYSGGVVSQVVSATVSTVPGGARVSVRVAATVAGLGENAVRIGINTSLRGFERCVVTRFGTR